MAAVYHPRLTPIGPMGWARLGVALSALLLVPGADAWTLGGFFGDGAKDQVSQRPVSDWAQEGATGVIPFTSMAAEKAAIGQQLACTWTSVSGTEAQTYGRTDANRAGRYDFLCKGGTWAGVSLMLDSAPGFSDGIGRVRLLWREWPAATRPGESDERVARQFMRLVADRLVPANLSGVVQKAFMATHSHTWWAGRVLRISYSVDDQREYVLHRLEITGLAAQMTNPAEMLPVSVPVATPAVPAAAVETGLTKPGSEITQPVRQPAFTPLPDSSGLIKLPQPKPAKPAQAPLTAAPLVVPADVLPAKEVSPALAPATAADLAGPPDPISLQAPVPLPSISTSLVPDAASLLNGRPSAPSNFADYNKATALTRSEESKARARPDEGSKIKAVQATSSTQTVQGSGGLVKPLEAPSVAPSLEALGTPTATAAPLGGVVSAASGTVVTSGTVPLVANSTGLTKATVAASPTDPRFETSRPLPQLQYVPKAKPLARPDEVLKFDDEGGQL